MDKLKVNVDLLLLLHSNIKSISSMIGSFLISSSTFPFLIVECFRLNSHSAESIKKLPFHFCQHHGEHFIMLVMIVFFFSLLFPTSAQPDLLFQPADEGYLFPLASLSCGDTFTHTFSVTNAPMALAELLLTYDTWSGEYAISLIFNPSGASTTPSFSNVR